jgi:hypothetical protein
VPHQLTPAQVTGTCLGGPGADHPLLMHHRSDLSR